MKQTHWVVLILLISMLGYIFGRDKITQLIESHKANKTISETVIDTNLNLDTSEYNNYTLDDLKDIFQNGSGTKEFDPVANYKKTQNIKDLYIVIDYYINLYQYDKAAKYFEELIGKTTDRDRAKFMDILVNNFDGSPVYYKQVRQLLEWYKSGGTISIADYYFYDIILDWLHGNYKQDKINNLSDKYTSIKNQLWWAVADADKYKDAPDYYKLWLLNMVFFKNNYFGVAKNISDRLISKNPKYILPYQIKAYIWLSTNYPDIAISQLNILMELDSDNIDYYHQLLGIAYYAKGDYTTAANHFLQVKSDTYIEDKTRFLIDIYRRQKDDNKITSMYYEQYKIRMKPVDFQGFFDWFVYDRISTNDKSFVNIKNFYNQNKELYIMFLKKCIDITSKDPSFKNVCDYWQAGYDLANNDHDQALKKLVILVQKYPDSQVYYTIGNLYLLNWETEKAKKYIIHAIITSKNDTNKNNLKNLLIEMVKWSSNTWDINSWTIINKINTVIITTWNNKTNNITNTTWGSIVNSTPNNISTWIKEIKWVTSWAIQEIDSGVIQEIN